MGYLFIICATILFGIQFGFTKKFQTVAGEGLKTSFLYNAISPIVFAIVMFFIAKDRLSFAPFTVICSLIWAVIANAITYFSIKSLALGSVANYSVFLLGGGMVLPAVYGFFFGDTITVFKIIGILFILAAVCVKLDFKEKNGLKAYLCFFAMFVMNGLIGILSSVYQGDIFVVEKSSAEQFAFMRAIFTAILGAVMLLVLSLKSKAGNNKSLAKGGFIKASAWALGSGALNGVANLLLLYALLTLDPSLQYPLVTGGAILVSVVIGLFFKEKVDKKTLLSVIFTVIGSIVIVF